MKKSFNVIQINGFRGILYLAFIGVCLAAGFGWFPGWLCMKLWNLASANILQIPAIGIFQGILLWGIIAGAYFTFRKNKLVVCMKASEGLSEEELKAIFADMKRTVQDDAFMRSMIKAKKAELKINNFANVGIPKTDPDKNKEKIETK